MCDDDVINIPDDIFRRIIFDYIPKYEWAKLEQVSPQFRRITLSTYALLRTVNIGDFFPPLPYTDEKKTKKLKRMGNASKKLKSILIKLTTHSPKLKKLTGFSDASLLIKKKHFDSLKQLKELTSVNFNQCEFNIKFFCDYLSAAKNLRHLDVSKSVFQKIPKGTVLPQTRYSSIPESSVQYQTHEYQRLFIDAEYLLENMAQMNCLTSLALSNVTQFTGCFLLSINVANIKSITFIDCKFYSEYVCQFLEKCSALESLTLWTSEPLMNEKTDVDKHSAGGIINRYVFQCLPNLKQLHKLRIMDYSDFYAAKPDEFHFFVENALSECRNLQELSLFSKFVVNEKLLNKISLHCPDLKVLQIDNDALVEANVLLPFSNLKRLHALTFFSKKEETFDGCKNIDYRQKNISLLPHRLYCLGRIAVYKPQHSLNALRNLLQFKHLKEVLTNGSYIDDYFVEQLCLNFCSQLTVLELPFCYSVSDHAVNYIAMCRKLKVLNLRNSRITDEGYREIGSNCNSLCEVDFHLNDSRCLSWKSMIHVLDHCPNMKRVLVNTNDVLAVQEVRSKVNLRFNVDICECGVNYPFLSSPMLR